MGKDNVVYYIERFPNSVKTLAKELPTDNVINTDKKRTFYEIARAYSILLRISQMASLSPFRIMSDRKTGVLKLEFKFLSGWFFYSVTSDILIIFFLITYFLNRELNVDLGFQL